MYDAKSGRLLHGDVIQPAKPKRPPSVDGFVKPIIIKPTSRAEQSKPVPKAASSRTSATVNHKRRTAQKSQILMRRAVQRPAHALAGPKVTSSNRVVDNGERNLRAQATAKSPYIHRYTSSPQSHVVKKSAPLTVQEPPKKAATHSAAQAQTHAKASPTHHSAPNVSRPINKSEALFNKALESANSPKKGSTKHRKRSKTAKRTGMASAMTATVLLVGFITYLNWPNLNLKLASSQAGFAAEMPGYQPAGYSFKGPVNYQAGKVTVSFKSNTDNRGYSIQQEVSNWNSQSLEDNFLTAQNKTYEVQQESGRTIYLYDNGQATWVNGGVWYQLDGSSLSTDQLMKVAASL